MKDCEEDCQKGFSEPHGEIWTVVRLRNCRGGLTPPRGERKDETVTRGGPQTEFRKTRTPRNHAGNNNSKQFLSECVHQKNPIKKIPAKRKGIPSPLRRGMNRSQRISPGSIQRIDHYHKLLGSPQGRRRQFGPYAGLGETIQGEGKWSLGGLPISCVR